MMRIALASLLALGLSATVALAEPTAATKATAADEMRFEP
jgi:hypothetical protein